MTKLLYIYVNGVRVGEPITVELQHDNPNDIKITYELTDGIITIKEENNGKI